MLQAIEVVPDDAVRRRGARQRPAHLDHRARLLPRFPVPHRGSPESKHEEERHRDAQQRFRELRARQPALPALPRHAQQLRVTAAHERRAARHEHHPAHGPDHVVPRPPPQREDHAAPVRWIVRPVIPHRLGTNVLQPLLLTIHAASNLDLPPSHASLLFHPNHGRGTHELASYTLARRTHTRPPRATANTPRERTPRERQGKQPVHSPGALRHRRPVRSAGPRPAVVRPNDFASPAGALASAY